MAGKGLALTRRSKRNLLLAAVILLCTLLAACSATSSGSGGINFSLGLAGSTTDHPGKPPTIAANGPSGAYAFVYDNQVWLRQDGATQAAQLTHLTLSNGSSIAWGPLVWSPDGRFIAFTVVENLNLTRGGASRSSGPLYYLDTTTEPATLYTSAGTGSIYGHSYTWFGNSLLLYANGSGIQMFTAGDADPRAWQVVAVPDGQQTGATGSDIFALSDIQVSGGSLYYTLEDIRSPGNRGVVGAAALMSAHIGSPGDYAETTPSPTVNPIANLLPLSNPQQVASLGQVYAEPGGAFVAGAWQIHGAQLAIQRIQQVNSQAETVTSQVCVIPTAAQNNNGCGTSVPGAADTQPITVHPQFAFGGGDKIAYNGDGLYLNGVSGAYGAAGWSAPPVWSPDGEVAVTEIVSSQADSSGVTRITTNIALVDRSGQGEILVKGGQNIAWKPA